jgi:hypothetical protein
MKTAALIKAWVMVGVGFVTGSGARILSSEPSALNNPAITQQLKTFIAEKEAQARAAEKDISVFKPLFEAASRLDWLAASNAFIKLQSHAGQYKQSGQIDMRLRGTAWAAAMEIWGGLQAFYEGDEKYSLAFGTNIIASIPAGSVYFGGTDPGRFLITALCESQVNRRQP